MVDNNMVYLIVTLTAKHERRWIIIIVMIIILNTKPTKRILFEERFISFL